MACRAGAGHVYSVDRGGIVGVARDLARANGFDERISFIRAFSPHAPLPTNVDVIVGDQLGPFGVEAGLVEYFADARDRCLNRGGRIVPALVALQVAPVECRDFPERVGFWSSRPAGFDVTPLGTLAANTSHQVDLVPADLLGDPATLVSLDLATVRPGLIRASAAATIARNGELNGIGGWFSARLSPGSGMSNSPLAAGRIDRRQAFFPIDRPLAVREGDRVRIQMRMLPAASIVTWQVAVESPGAGPAVFVQSTWRGRLMSEEDLDCSSPGSIPRLDARAQAWRTVLTSCDGRRTLAEIERLLLESHPDLFPSANDAASFVAEVLGRCAE